MTKKKYLETVEEVLALKDTDTKIYKDNTTGGYYQFIGGVLCRFYSNSTPVFNAGIDVNGDYYILVEEPVKEVTEEDIGKLCWFWDSSDDRKFPGLLTDINYDDAYSFCCRAAGYYSQCCRMSPSEVAEITGYRVEE